MEVIEADEYILRFEQPRFKFVTSTEEAAAAAGGLGGFLGSVVTVIYLSRTNEISTPFDTHDISFHVHSVEPELINLPIPSISFKSTAEPSKPAHTQTTIEAASPSAHIAPPLEYQIGGVAGMVALIAFAAAAATSSLRYAGHKRKEHFKSSVSKAELRKWYDSPSASAAKDI